METDMNQELIATLMRERDKARADIVRLSDLAIIASDSMESAIEAMEHEMNEVRKVMAQQAAEIQTLRAEVERLRAGKQGESAGSANPLI